ncbi:unnamed protein product [Microthlaspi erraticum]|uniref:Uncharacterized protein n=1 Tax=Microthlaspi erraticum TaxID=1685480 RepID=A0A6D2JJL7_9BRAS|nr:unnamed protein product [Microthlaspi erraticum]
MLSKAKKGSHIRTRDNKGFEMKRLRFQGVVTVSKMEISYLDKQEGYENGKECPDIAPQRTGRQGRGLERADGHQGTPLGVHARSIELALDSIELCLELATFFLKPAPAGLDHEEE